jgi:hypothetical protein
MQKWLWQNKLERNPLKAQALQWVNSWAKADVLVIEGKENKVMALSNKPVS